MNGSPPRHAISALQRFGASTLVLCALFFPPPARAQFPLPQVNSTRSASGQFVVAGARQSSPLADSLAVVTNENFVRLEPALLAVSAERIKQSLWRELGVNGAWRGQIFITLHPAQSLDEDVTVVSDRSAGGWNYRVALPDVLTRERFLRAMTGVLLLEFANRDAGSRPAETPAWLTDGLSQSLLAQDAVQLILSSPSGVVNGVRESRTVETNRLVNPLAVVRRVLRNHSVLTFEQLSWPTGAQLSGADGAVYRASAQLFISKLLDLKNGPAHLRAMLRLLPRFYNWQTAFQTAFHDVFPTPLDVEKWWALQVVDFAAHTSGPRLTPAASRERLDEILTVPADVRYASNALPAHADISLQAVIRNFDLTRQRIIFQTRIRDLEVAQFCLARSQAALAAEYRRTLADYLTERAGIAPHRSPWNKHPKVEPLKILLRDTLKTLDALDAQRRALESAARTSARRS
jgi:hypothetical protein